MQGPSASKPIRVDVEGFGLVEFPAGTSKEQIRRTLAEDPAINKAQARYRLHGSLDAMGIPSKIGVTQRGKEGVVADPAAYVDTMRAQEMQQAQDYSLLGSKKLGQFLGKAISLPKNLLGGIGSTVTPIDDPGTAFDQAVRAELGKRPFTERMGYSAGARSQGVDPQRPQAYALEQAAERSMGLLGQLGLGFESFGKGMMQDPVSLVATSMLTPGALLGRTGLAAAVPYAEKALGGAFALQGADQLRQAAESPDPVENAVPGAMNILLGLMPWMRGATRNSKPGEPTTGTSRWDIAGRPKLPPGPKPGAPPDRPLLSDHGWGGASVKDAAREVMSMVQPLTVDPNHPSYAAANTILREATEALRSTGKGRLKTLWDLRNQAEAIRRQSYEPEPQPAPGAAPAAPSGQRSAVNLDTQSAQPPPQPPVTRGPIITPPPRPPGKDYGSGIVPPILFGDTPIPGDVLPIYPTQSRADLGQDFGDMAEGLIQFEQPVPRSQQPSSARPSVPQVIVGALRRTKGGMTAEQIASVLRQNGPSVALRDMLEGLAREGKVERQAVGGKDVWFSPENAKPAQTDTYSALVSQFKQQFGLTSLQLGDVADRLITAQDVAKAEGIPLFKAKELMEKARVQALREGKKERAEAKVREANAGSVPNLPGKPASEPQMPRFVRHAPRPERDFAEGVDGPAPPQPVIPRQPEPPKQPGPQPPARVTQPEPVNTVREEPVAPAPPTWTGSAVGLLRETGATMHADEIAARTGKNPWELSGELLMATLSGEIENTNGHMYRSKQSNPAPSAQGKGSSKSVTKPPPPVSQDVEFTPPGKAPQAPTATRDDAPLSAEAGVVLGKTGTTRTPVKRSEVSHQWAVVPIDRVIPSQVDNTLQNNPAYDQGLQPRDRAKAATKEQVERIARTLDPNGLGDSATTAEGAPIVGGDLQVESGNGRVLGLRRSKAAYPERWQAYQDWLKANAAEFGVDPASIPADGVLVRLRQGYGGKPSLTGKEREAFAVEAGEETTLAKSPAEIAQFDAKRMVDAGILRPDRHGRYPSGESREFAARWFGTLGEGERSGLYSDNGGLNSDAYVRLNRALAVAVVDNPEIVSRWVEYPDDNTRQIFNAVKHVAPKLATLRQGAESGEFYDLALGDELASATKEIIRIRENGWDYDTWRAQLDLFGTDPVVSALVKEIWNRRRSARQIAEFLDNYGDAAISFGNPAQESLSGLKRQAPTKLETLQAAQRMEAAHGTQNLFGEEELPAGATVGGEIGGAPGDGEAAQAGGGEREAAGAERGQDRPSGTDAEAGSQVQAGEGAAPEQLGQGDLFDGPISLASGFDPKIVMPALRQMASIAKSFAEFTRAAVREFGPRIKKSLRQAWNYLKGTAKPGVSNELNLPQGPAVDAIRNFLVQNLSTLHRVNRKAWVAATRYAASGNSARVETHVATGKVLEHLSAEQKKRFQTYLVADRILALRDRLAEDYFNAMERGDKRAMAKAQLHVSRLWRPLDPVTSMAVTESSIQAFFRETGVREAVAAHRGYVEPLMEGLQEFIGVDPTGLRGKYSDAFTPAVTFGADGQPIMPAVDRSFRKAKAQAAHAPGTDAFTGTSDWYNPDYEAAILNRVSRSMQVANAKILWQTLVKQGIATTEPQQAMRFDGRDVPAQMIRAADAVGSQRSGIPEKVWVPNEVARELSVMFEAPIATMTTQAAQGLLSRFVSGFLLGPAEAVVHGMAIAGRTGLILPDGGAKSLTAKLAKLTPETRSIRALVEVLKTDFTPDEVLEAARLASRYGAIRHDWPVKLEASKPDSYLGGRLLYGPGDKAWTGLHVRALALIHRYGQKAGMSNAQIGELMQQLNTHVRGLQSRAQKGSQSIGMGTFYQTGMMNRVVGFRYGLGIAMLAGGLILQSVLSQALDPEGKGWWERPGQKVGSVYVGNKTDEHGKPRPVYWDVLPFLNRPAAYAHGGIKSGMESAVAGANVSQGAVRLAATVWNQFVGPFVGGPIGGVATAVTGMTPFVTPNQRVTGLDVVPAKSAQSDFLAFDRLRDVGVSAFPAANLFGMEDGASVIGLPAKRMGSAPHEVTRRLRVAQQRQDQEARRKSGGGDTSAPVAPPKIPRFSIGN